MQAELSDSLPIEIIENIWPKVEGDCRVTINKNHRGKNDTCKNRFTVISRITSMVGPQVPEKTNSRYLWFDTKKVYPISQHYIP